MVCQKLGAKLSYQEYLSIGRNLMYLGQSPPVHFATGLTLADHFASLHSIAQVYSEFSLDFFLALLFHICFFPLLKLQFFVLEFLSFHCLLFLCWIFSLQCLIFCYETIIFNLSLNLLGNHHRHKKVQICLIFKIS